MVCYLTEVALLLLGVADQRFGHASGRAGVVVPIGRIGREISLHGVVDALHWKTSHVSLAVGLTEFSQALKRFLRCCIETANKGITRRPTPCRSTQYDNRAAALKKGEQAIRITRSPGSGHQVHRLGSRHAGGD